MISSKSASQTQETSRPSAIRSLRAIHRSRPSACSRAASSRSVRSTSLAPAGFLISRIETGVPATSIVSTRPNAACTDASAPTALLERDAQAQRGRQRGQRVVDVVEAGKRELELRLALRGPQARPRPGHAAELDLRGREVGLGAVGPAVGAAVVAEVADEGPLVRVGVAAAPAVLRVVRVLELGQGLGRVLDPEVGDPRPATKLAVAAEVGDQRVVGVEHEAAASGALVDHRRPLVRERLELAVAVELVAEEVAEHDEAGVELGRDARQPRLVDLEQALGAALLQQRRRHAPAHVRARAVVHRIAPRGAQRGGEHAGRGRLAVGRADDRRSLRELRAEAGDRVGRDAQQESPGEGGAAAAAAAPAERPGRPRDPDLGPKGGRAHPGGAGAGTITRRARGSRLTTAGRSAMWSPSA